MGSPNTSLEEMQGSAVMALHPAHQNLPIAGFTGLQALTAEIAASIFIASSGAYCEPSNPDALDQSISVHVNGQHLSIRPLDGRNVDVPLLLSEVARGKDRATGVPLLAISKRASNSYWLVSIRGDAEAAGAMLDVLGAGGAIRSDFDACYHLVPSPIGQRPTATIYAACRRHAGHGRNGTIRMSDDSEEGSIGEPDYAAKVTTRQPSNNSDQLSEELRTEVAMLSAVQDHPNVLRFHGLFWLPDADDAGETRTGSTGGRLVNGKRWLLVMERYTGGYLYDVVARGCLCDLQARSVIRGLLPALVHIHGRGIVHRDVKPENILLASDGRAVLSDFSQSCRLSNMNEMTRKCGSPCYAAPELLSGDLYSAKVDVFSVGCVLFYMLSARVPFEGSSLARILERVTQCAVDFSMSASFATVSSECKEFILLLLRKNEGDRPTAVEASRASWLCGDRRPNLPFLLVGPNNLRRSSRLSASRPKSPSAGREMHSPRTCTSTRWSHALKLISSSSPQRGLNSRSSTLHMAHVGDVEEPPGKKTYTKRASLPAGWAWESDSSDTAEADREEHLPRKQELHNRKASLRPQWRRQRSIMSSRDHSLTPAKWQRQESFSEDPATFPRLGAIQPPPPAHCKYFFGWDSKVAWAASRQRVSQGGSL